MEFRADDVKRSRVSNSREFDLASPFFRLSARYRGRLMASPYPEPC